ncbi:MAG: hypothetical protein ABR962_10700 [Candidatus Bathyarchaeia archaeon]
MALWALYTCVENNSLRILGRNLGMNLKPERVFALIGILSAVMGYYFSPSYPIMFFLPLFPALFASPFLIASCILTIRELKIKRARLG